MDLKDKIVAGTLYPIVQAIPESLSSDTVTIIILRLSDGYTWNFNTLVFGVPASSGNMGFVSDILWQQSFTPPTNDTYIVTIFDQTLNQKYTQYLTAAGLSSVIPDSYAQSKIRIWNMAIYKVTGKEVTSDSEDSVSQRVCSVFWDDILNEVLAEAPWTFAQKRAALALLAQDPVFNDDDMRFVYAKPSDFIKVNFINNPSATWKVEGDQILSNWSPLKIIYTARIDDPSKYFPLFTSALATRLAAEIAPKLSESKTMKKDLLKEYEEIRLPRAISGDSQQGSPQQPIQDEWEISRFTDSGALVAQPGSQTWHPVW